MAGMLQSFIAGGEAGRAALDSRRSDQRRSRLAELASQAYGAAPDQQQGFVQQAIANDASSGLALGESLSSGRDADMKRLAQKASFFVGSAKAGSDVSAMYPQLAQEASRLGLPVPTTYDEKVLAGLERFAQAYGGEGAPSGLREFQGMTAGLKPEDVEKARRIQLGLDPRQSSAAIGYQKITGPDGREYLVATDPRSVGVQTMGGGPAYGSFAGQPQGQPGSQGNPLPQGGTDAVIGQIMASANQLIAGGVPEARVDAWVQEQTNAAGGGTQAPPQPAQGGALPPRLDYQSGGSVNPFASRLPEETEAAKEAAKQRIQLNYLPEQEAAKTQAALNQAQGMAEIDLGKERAAKAAEKRAALGVYEQAMAGLKSGLSQTNTGPLAGRLPALTTGQQVAEGGVAAMAPILKQMFRTAGEGTFTDKDQDLLMAMVPTRKDTPEARAAKLKNIDNIVRAKLGTAPANSAGAESDPLGIL